MDTVDNKRCTDSKNHQRANDSRYPTASPGGEPKHDRDNESGNEGSVTAGVGRVELRWGEWERQKRGIRTKPVHDQLHDCQRKPGRGDSGSESGRHSEISRQRKDDARENNCSDDGRYRFEDQIDGVSQ